MTTYIQEVKRINVRRMSAGEILRTVIALLDRQQRGWRVAEIAVTIEHPVAVEHGHAPRQVKP